VLGRHFARTRGVCAAPREARRCRHLVRKTLHLLLEAKIEVMKGANEYEGYFRVPRNPAFAVASLEWVSLC
jgi:hypothetical protein